MKHATGLSVQRFARPPQWVGQSEPRHTAPVAPGVGGSLRAALVYLRHNPPQAALMLYATHLHHPLNNLHSVDLIRSAICLQNIRRSTPAAGEIF